MKFKEVQGNEAVSTAEVALVRNDIDGYSIALRLKGKTYLITFKDLAEALEAEQKNEQA